jgi:WD40 repeat protein
MKSLNFSNPTDIDPYIVLRGHTGPLFSLAQSPDNLEQNIIYTAGNEGIIKIWKIPKMEEISQYGDTDTIFNCNIGFFQKSTEVVWDMKHHPKQVNIYDS